MTKREIIKRYKEWLKNPTTLPYLETWEQWRNISYDDPELYKAICDRRTKLGLDTKTNSVGLDFLPSL